MRSLTVKLTLAFIVVALTGIVIVALLVYGATSNEFNRFLVNRGLSDYTAVVTSYFEAHGSWDGVEDTLRQKGMTYPVTSAHAGDRTQPPPFVLVDASGRALAAAGRIRAGDQMTVMPGQQIVEISANGQAVGYVFVTGRLPLANPFEERFLARTNTALFYAALGAMALAVLLGLFLARTITRPVRDLTLATKAMAKGQLSQKVPVRSNDELGELTETFNQMSADLDHSNSLRRQMTADIAHDLRTPLSVITGYLEGLKDGVVKPSEERFAAMHDEALFLQRLVEDLRILTLADAGELSINYSPYPPDELIHRLAGSFQHQAELRHIRLRTEIAEPLPKIQVDPERMLEALGNLVSNALRFTPDDGEVLLAARREGDTVVLEVCDTGVGISSEDLPRVFERFYRSDESRQEGGSGLGLAIAKSIVELQGGKIGATSSGPGQGSEFSIVIPIEQKNS